MSQSLFEKYNTPGPRYTSYPTVPYWIQSPTEDQWLNSLASTLDQSLSTGVGASLYIHIPFCESLCTYCGCNTRIVKNHNVADPYIDTVLKEWALYLSRLNRKIVLSEIHLGGGTPTFLSVDQLKTLMNGILSSAEVASQYEFSVEVDPRVTTPEHLNALYSLGFTRLSLGVQDFDPAVQNIVRRIQSEEQVETITHLARDIGYKSVNYDLIYGLPLQTLSSIERTMKAVRRLRPDRVAFYGYAHVPWIKPSQRKFTEEDIPTGEKKRSLYELGRNLLEEVGYHEIGMDHFALEQEALWQALNKGTLHRNFMGYSPRKVSPLIGLGVSAIGDSWKIFAQNEKLLESYQARVEKGELPILRGHVLSHEDLVLRQHILNLMTVFSTSWKNPELKVEYLNDIQKRLSSFVQDGLVEVDEFSCFITPRGRAFLKNICMVFDARLNARSN